MSHSDIKKLDHFTEVTHYLLLSQVSIFQQKAERETIALLNEYVYNSYLFSLHLASNKETKLLLTLCIYFVNKLYKEHF